MSAVEAIERPGALVEVRSAEGVAVDVICRGGALVEVASVGVQGPAGGTSPPFRHLQSTPSDTWIVNHNLGWQPQDTILSAGSVEVAAEVIHASINQCSVHFNTPQSGVAIMR